MTVSGVASYQCRLCMGSDNFQLCIFREDFQHKQILFKIRTCLPIKVEKGDGLPSTICYKCLARLDSSFELWNQSFNAEAILKHNLTIAKVHPFLNNKIQKHEKYDILNQYDKKFCPTGPDILNHEDFEDSLLDSLEENTWNSANNDATWQRFSYHNNHLIRKNPKTETYDIVSDRNLSELDEISQKKAWLSAEPRVCSETNSTDKSTELIERSPSFQSVMGSNLKSHENNWRDNSNTHDASVNEESNRYIHKNLFTSQSINGHGRLTKPQSTNEVRDECLFANLSKQDVNRRRSLFPWQMYKEAQCGKKLKINEEAFPEHGKSKSEHTNKSNISAESDSQEGYDIGGLVFDLNQCPKCKKILTPSQNLLSHIQSHRA